MQSTEGKSQVGAVGDNAVLALLAASKDRHAQDAELAPIALPGTIATICTKKETQVAWKTSLAGSIVAVLAMLIGGCATSTSPDSMKKITSFENGSPFVHAPIILEFPDVEKAPPDPRLQVVSDHATSGGKALKLHNGTLTLEGPLDWSGGYDYLKFDVFSDCPKQKLMVVLLEDPGVTGHYWWQGQLFAPIMPGKNEVILPIAGIRGGGKGRPFYYGPLDLAHLTRVSFKVFQGDIWSCDYADKDALYMDNIRLEKDTGAAKYQFPGLLAYDVGTDQSPVMPGFKRLGPSDMYTKEKGFGLLPDTQISDTVKRKQALDFYRPDPLYRDFIAIDKGGVQVDLPNGKYRVFVNIDLAGGFWGEVQHYRERKVWANGEEVVDDKMTFAQAKDRQFGHFDIEDWPGLDVWEKYVRPCYQEKQFDVDVTDGSLKLEFEGKGLLPCALSALVIYPADRTTQGEEFLKWVKAKQKWYFNVENKEIMHTPTGKYFAASSKDHLRGFALFGRAQSKDVFYNDKPEPREAINNLQAEGFKGQSIPMDLGIVPLKDLGKVTVSVSDMTAQTGAKVPASAFDIGYFSYRIRRSSYEGVIYTMSPRYIRTENSIAMPKDITRRFWLRANVPADAAPGQYKGQVSIATEKNGTFRLPIELTVLHGSLDEADVPAGPFGHTIDIPWFGDDPKAADWNAKLTATSMQLIRSAGFTSFTGLPVINYKGFKDGKPVLDFTVADRQMKQAREAGFKLPVASYCGMGGLGLYTQDTKAMQAAGFTDYSEFIKAVFSAVQKHADENNWLPVYYSLGDEPAGKEDVLASKANADAYRKAFPDGPPWFTLFGSCVTGNPEDPHFQLGTSFHAVAWNLHSEESVNALHKAGGQFAIYNNVSRWGYGDYLYKAVKQFGCKFHEGWIWNCAGGDPYFGLDCREDDYCWVNATPDGRLVSTRQFEEVREGITDYRCLLTLARLANEKAGTPAAAEAQDIIKKRMDSFKLGDREGFDDYAAFRKKVIEAIDKLAAN